MVFNLTKQFVSLLRLCDQVINIDNSKLKVVLGSNCFWPFTNGPDVREPDTGKFFRGNVETGLRALFPQFALETFLSALATVSFTVPRYKLFEVLEGQEPTNIVDHVGVRCLSSKIEQIQEGPAIGKILTYASKWSKSFTPM